MRAVDEENETGVLPPPMPAMYTEEKTYPLLLGVLDGDADVWAELLFADPIADIAVLGSPDIQALGEEAYAFDNLVDAIEPLTIAALPPRPMVERRLPDGMSVELGETFVFRGDGNTPARLLSLAGDWIPCRVEYLNGPLWIKGGLIEGGMSGSPIVNEEGGAIGLISVGGESEGGPNPCLTRHLPAWLVIGDST
jgi:hypothetical protein